MTSYYLIILLLLFLSSAAHQELPSINEQILISNQYNSYQIQPNNIQNQNNDFKKSWTLDPENRFYFFYTLFIIWNAISSFYSPQETSKMIKKINKILLVLFGAFFLYSKFSNQKQVHYSETYFLFIVLVLTQTLYQSIITYTNWRIYMEPAPPTDPIAVIQFQNIKNKDKWGGYRSCAEFIKKVDDVCPICLTEYNCKKMKKDKRYCDKYGFPTVVKTVCNHYFHWYCIQKWIARQKVNCPLDNQQMFFI